MPGWSALNATGQLGDWDADRADNWLSGERRAIPEGTFIVTFDGRPAATCCTIPPTSTERRAELGWLSVAPEHQGRGLGYQACLAVLHFARRMGYAEIYLNTDDWRLPAVKTYLALGFEPEMAHESHPRRWESGVRKTRRRRADRTTGGVDKMLRLGLIGVGHGSTLMQVNSPEHDDVPMRVTAVCDVNEDRMAAAAAEYGVSRTTTDFRELVEGDDIDVVGVYSPGPLHADQVVAALDAGKHVMVTKSMVYSIEEAERVVEAVDRTGLVLLVTQTMRGDAKHMESKRLCDSGVIGDLLVGEATYIHDLRPVYARTPWRTQMPQDLLLGGACHPIDALRWFFGDVDEVHCYGLRGGVAKDYPQEDNFVINLRFKSGRIGRVAALCGVVHPPTLLMNGLNLYGTKGTIVDGRVRLEPEGIVPSREYDVTFPETQRGHGTEMIVMMDHMVDCVVNGATPWVGVREGARVVATGLACWESMRTGQPAKVRNDF